MLPYFTEHYGNASSLHSFGRDPMTRWSWPGRERARPWDSAQGHIFTSGGTESDNLALQGAAYALASKGKHIITSMVEHHAILHTCLFLETQGFKVHLSARRTPRACLSGEPEERHDQGDHPGLDHDREQRDRVHPAIKELADVAKDGGACSYDAVQAMTKVPLDMSKLKWTCCRSRPTRSTDEGSGRAVHPQGRQARRSSTAGARRGCAPRRRTIPGIVGLGKALEIGMSEMEESVAKMTKIRDRSSMERWTRVPPPAPT
jgi:cysteine desulfurase